MSDLTSLNMYADAYMFGLVHRGSIIAFNGTRITVKFQDLGRKTFNIIDGSSTNPKNALVDVDTVIKTLTGLDGKLK